MSESIFIEQERWNQGGHSHKDLKELRNASPAEIRFYFTQRALNGTMLRQMGSSQLMKVERTIKSSKLKSIYKQRMRCRNRIDASEVDLEAKASSSTQFEEEEQQ